MAVHQLVDLGPTITSLKDDLGLSIEEFSGALGVHPRTLERWLENVSYPQRDSRERFDQLCALRERLHETFDSAEAIHAWMQARNRYLGSMTPAEAARVGRIDVIENALEALDSGIFV